jgi:hypothetical protein
MSVFILAYVPLFYLLIIQNNSITSSFALYSLQCSALYHQNIGIFESVTSPYKNILQVLTERSLKRSIGHMLDG